MQFACRVVFGLAAACWIWSSAAAQLNPEPAKAQSMSPPKKVRSAKTLSQMGFITFDEYPVNTCISDQYQSKGVTFNGGFIELDGLPEKIFLSADNESYPDPYGNGFRAAPITANFVAVTPFVQARPTYLDMYATMTITAFNARDEKIGEATGSESDTVRVDAPGIVKAVFSFNADHLDDIAGIHLQPLKSRVPTSIPIRLLSNWQGVVNRPGPPNWKYRVAERR